MVHVKSLNGRAAPHTVLIELDDQKLVSRGMASIKSVFIYFLNIFISLKVSYKHFKTSYLQNKAVNELKGNFISLAYV